MKEPWGRWLGSVARDGDAAPPGAVVERIAVERIHANPYQPRGEFDDAKLRELSETIRLHGVIQPIVVRQVGVGYELVAGERRWRAVQLLGLPDIPAIVRVLSDEQAASLALIENLQRENLTAIEEAAAYQRLLEIHRMTQESLAQSLGRSQSTVANKLRLLSLADAVQEAVRKREISERHARALLQVDVETQLALLREVREKDMTVKEIEARVMALRGARKGKPRIRKSVVARDVRFAVNTIRESVRLARETGLTLVVEERDGENYVEFVIRVQKERGAEAGKSRSVLNSGMVRR